MNTMIRVGRRAAALVLLALSGCMTLTPDPVPAPVAVVPPRETPLEADVRALQEWRREVRVEQESRAQEIEQVRRQLAALESDFREHQQAVRVQVQDLETARERDRQFVVDELTRKLVALQASMTPPAPPAPPPRTGYEHVVKAGESLGLIAKAYKVSVDSILKANKIANPDSIRIGQKLLIPD